MGKTNKLQKTDDLKLPFSYSIRRSQRATKTRIVVSPGHKVEVVAPPQIPEHRLHQFVSEKQSWIVSAINKIADRQTPEDIPKLYFDGAPIIYQGLPHTLKTVATKLKRVKVTLLENIISIHVPESLPLENQSDALKTALTSWMKQQARLQVQHYVTQHASKKQLFPRAIIIKTQKSRWGSCGIHNDININWLLVIAPPEVLEYVVVHELCHIRVRNHSPRFWQLVGEHLPDYQEQRLWLKQHGSELMRGL